MDLPIGVDQARKSWFMNMRRSGGFQLTKVGHDTLINFKFESWAVDVSDIKVLSPRVMLTLDQKIRHPFYINFREKKIVFFGSSDAMLLTLYGNFDQYLKSL